MAAFKGKDANVIWDASTGGIATLDLIQSWSASATQDVVDITSMQDTWETYTGGFIDFTASVECLLDTSGSSIPLAAGGTEALGEDTPAKLELYLLHDTGDYKAIYGSAICTAVRATQNKDNVATVTYDFQGTGVLAYWDAATVVVY